MRCQSTLTAHFHLPGLFEFYELYARFLPLFYEHRDWFYDWCDIGSIYGAPADCLWGGGRVGFGDADAHDVLSLLEKFGISARLTFSNSLLKSGHLADRRCNKLCALFEDVALSGARPQNENNSLSGTSLPTEHNLLSGRSPQNESNSLLGAGLQQKPSARSGYAGNGVIVHSELLLDYLRKTYPGLYLVSSTTKVLIRFEDLRAELARDEFAYVVPDFRLNKAFDALASLSAAQKDKVEFLCNECCPVGCTERARCYENVSRLSLGEPVDDFECYGARLAEKSGERFEGSGSEISAARLEGSSADKCAGHFEDRVYSFSRAMESPAFISIEDIQERYMPLGFSNFKIEGRSLGSALILEFLLYYLTKPEAQLRVRESIYLDSALDLF